MQNQGEQKDRELWAALKQSHEKALSDLFLAYAESLYNYGYMLCRNKELVEDCLQDLFLALWKKRRNLSDVQRVQPYLMIALRHRIQDACRKKKRTTPLTVESHPLEQLGATSSIEEDWVASERESQQEKLIAQALAILPDRMRQAVYLRYFGGLEYADIAAIMDIRPQVAVNMVYRATKKLRAYSKEYSEWLFFCILSQLL